MKKQNQNKQKQSAHLPLETLKMKI